MTVFGIDLGNNIFRSRRVGADGEAKSSPTQKGALTTPSAVYFDEIGSVLVGQQAKDYGAIDADNTVTHIKRRMGERFESHPW